MMQEQGEYMFEVHLGRSPFSRQQWGLILLGKCPLACKVLPYLERLQAAREGPKNVRVFEIGKSVRVTGIGHYDGFMSIQAFLILLMMSTLRTEDFFWLADEELIEALRNLERGNPYMDDKDLVWGKSCIGVLIAIGRTVQQSLLRSADSGGWGLLRQPFDRVDGESRDGVVRQMGGMVDGTSLQMLKEIFYVVTGRRRGKVAGDHGNGVTEKLDMIPLKDGEWLGWRCVFPTRGSVECLNGTCSHLTGLVPVVGRS